VRGHTGGAQDWNQRQADELFGPRIPAKRRGKPAVKDFAGEGQPAVALFTASP